MSILTVEELATKVKVHRHTVMKWIKKGLPAIVQEKVIRIDEDKAMEWLMDGQKRKGK